MYHTAIKFVIVWKNLHQTEVEISDVFPSTSAMMQGLGTRIKSLDLGPKDPFKLKQEFFVPPPSTLLALKLSHLTLPFSWRKTAEDVVTMSQWFGKPVGTILEDSKTVDPLAGESGPNLSRLIDERLRENVTAAFIAPYKFPPCHQKRDSPCTLSAAEAVELLKQLRGENSALLKLIKAAEDVGDEPTSLLKTRFLPISLDADFWEWDCDEPNEKRGAILEFIMLVALSYYINSNRMDAYFTSSANMSAEKVAELAYHLALESICTNALAPVPKLSELKDAVSEAFVQKREELIRLYDFAPGQKSKQEQKQQRTRANAPVPSADTTTPFASNLENLVGADQKTPKELGNLRANPGRFPIASSQQVAELGILTMEDPLISAIFKDFATYWELPPLLVKYVAELQRKRGAEPVPLPVDIWQHVVSRSVDDHVTLLALSEVNKDLNNLILKSPASEAWWQRLLDNCWKEDRLQDALNQASIIEPGAIGKFKRIFQWNHKRFYSGPIKCEHCGDTHLPIPEEEWLKKNGNEHTEYFCACPDCYEHTGSWGTCEYHEIFILS